MAKLIDTLVAECARCVQTMGEEMDAVDMLVSESKKAVLFSMELRLCRIEFVLTVKNSMPCPKGTLFARILNSPSS